MNSHHKFTFKARQIHSIDFGFDKPTTRHKCIRGSYVWIVDNCGLWRPRGILSPMFCVGISEWELRIKKDSVNLSSVAVATCTYVVLPSCTGRWIEAGFNFLLSHWGPLCDYYVGVWNEYTHCEMPICEGFYQETRSWCLKCLGQTNRSRGLYHLPSSMTWWKYDQPSERRCEIHRNCTPFAAVTVFKLLVCQRTTFR